MTTYEEQLRAVARYYSRYRWEYDLTVRGVKHFGYRPDGLERIPERQAQELMQDLVIEHLNLPVGARVLDAGCGQGHVACYLAIKAGWRVEGVTITPFEVGSATRLARRMGLTEKVQFHLADYTATGFPDASFDGVYAMETLSHSPDPDRTLAEFRRLLRPGGRLTLHEYVIADDAQIPPAERTLIDAVIQGTAMHGLNEFRMGRFEERLTRSGFVGVDTQDITRNMIPSARRLTRFFRPIYPIVRALRLQKAVPHAVAACECHEGLLAGRMGYHVFTAHMPKQPELL